MPRELVQSFNMVGRRVLLGAMLALLCTGSVQAALPNGARERCIGDAPVDVDMRISACTTVIDAGALPDEDKGVAFANRGTAYLNKQFYVLAIDDYDQADRLRPDDANVLQGRCLARAVVNRDLDDALADCNRALELDSDDAQILGYRGFVYLRLGLNESAISDYTAALEAHPKSALHLYGRGEAKLRMGDAEGAEADIAAAKAIDPKIADSFAKLERDESMWTWVSLLEYWRSLMKMIY
jgi:tetratricopeptide (TPR) repeat protein